MFDGIVLTIAIPTVPSRGSVLSRALHSVTADSWVGEFYKTEVVVCEDADPAYPSTMTAKNNHLTSQARGEWIVFLDDDDYMLPGATSTVPKMLEALNVDFLGYKTLWHENGVYQETFKHTGSGSNDWWLNRGGRKTMITDRGVVQKCPVRVSRTVPWVERGVEGPIGTDRAWSRKVQKGITSHGFYDAPVYVYDHWGEHMVGVEAGEGKLSRPQRDVGLWSWDEGKVRRVKV